MGRARDRRCVPYEPPQYLRVQTDDGISMEEVEIVRDPDDGQQEKIRCWQCGLLFSYTRSRAPARYLQHRGTEVCAVEAKRWKKMKDSETETEEYTLGTTVYAEKQQGA